MSLSLIFIKVMRTKFSLTLLTAIFSTALLCSCTNTQPPTQSFDGREFDISVNQDKSLTLTSELKNGYYELTISGEGEAVDYLSATQVPWYAISQRVNKINIDYGIQNIGDYFFKSIPIEYIVLPKTTYWVGSNSFHNDTTIYTYGDPIGNISNDVYYYSETQPTKSGNYFHMENGVPVIWPSAPDPLVTPSFLFIGNSFTWRQGSEDDPAVPKNFKKIAANLGYETDIDFVVKSSHTLTKYADPNDEKGRIVEQKLTTNQYDYVILQEQSTTPLNNYNTFLSAVKKLKARIEATQNKCKVILYETWGSEASLTTTYPTIPDMEAALRSAYEKAANETGCSVNYVGKAFTYVYENRKDINIYADDNRHQNEYGAYLSAAVHVRSIFNIRVSGCTDYAGLDQTKCKTLLSVTDTVI